MNLRVEYLYDPESKNWSFVVPALNIIGGADTRDDAELGAIQAIEYALWSDAQEPPTDGSEIGYLTVTVERQTVASQRVG